MTSLFDRLNWDLEFFNSFYIAAGGPASDPHDLDRDNDGNACDNNGEMLRKKEPLITPLQGILSICKRDVTILHDFLMRQ